MPSQRRRFLLLPLLALLLALALGSGVAFGQSPHPDAPPADAAALLRSALDRVAAAGDYEMQVSMDQTVTPEQSLFSAASAETAHFEITGQVSSDKRARLTIQAGRASFGPINQDVQELLIDGDAIYQRQDGRWVRATDAAPTVGVGDQALSLAALARDVVFLDAVDGPPGFDTVTAQYQRVGFRIDPEDVVRHLIAQQGQLSEPARVLAELQTPRIGGRGELWIAPNGYPSRLILNLSWVRHGEEPLHIAVSTETNYTGFGLELPAAQFSPERSPETGAPLPELRYVDWLQPMLAITVIGGLLVLFWLLRRAQRGTRHAMNFVTALLILGLITPYLTPAINAAEPVRQLRGESDDPAVSSHSELGELLSDVREISQPYSVSESGGAGLEADDDEDGDTLPNGFELTLGTNPFVADTDFDGLTDAEEVKGVACAGRQMVSNPLNPDSNADGLRDGEEFWRGQCYKGNTLGWVWDDDNDDDLVPDGLDLSPFSNSIAEGFKGGAYDGADLSFESLDQDEDPNRTVIYPFYVELQVRPTKADSLRWAFKNLYWPGDTKGAIQNTDPVARFISEFNGNPIGSSGKLTLMPFLSATVREVDLPSASAKALYGVNYAPKKDDNGVALFENGKPLYDLSIPLMPIERGGQVYAFQAKMLHDQNGNTDLTRSWTNLRLKWAVIGDVLMPAEGGEAIPSPNGGYGIVVYDESYYITGLQVSRQGGASMMVSTMLPKEGVPYDDGLTTVLRAGLEAKFLTGELSMADIKQRFNSPTNATLEQRWGIPLDQNFRVVYDASTANYRHVDEAVATTTMTTTRQLLKDAFTGYTFVNPTFILASEQRTSTVNLDDDPAGNYKTITINTCLKPLITTRTLKLQTYEYVVEGDDLFGEFQPMSLDDVLALVEADYADATDAAYKYYNEELSILKMATTAWFIGQSSVTKIGARDFTKYVSALTDAKLVVQFLNEDGIMPTDFKDVVMEILKVFDQGGPVAWFEKQFTEVMGYWTKTKDFFEASYAPYGPPDSYIKVLPMPGDGSNGGQPAQPAPLITEKDFLGYTSTALTVLGYLAIAVGYFNEAAGQFLKDAVTIITKLVQIYQKIRAIIDTVKFMADSVGKPLEAVANAVTISKELSAIAKPMSLVGLVLTVGFIWASLVVQIGDVGPSVALALVLRAVVETVLLVALFVVAAIFPIGTLVALGIGLIKLIESVIGFTFDPLSLLIDFLFGVNVYERAKIDGEPQIGDLSLEPREPGGGLVAGQTFRLQLPSQIKLATTNDGTKADLEQARVQIHVGRFVGGTIYSLCTPSEELFNLYQERLEGYVYSIHKALEVDCVAFRLVSASGVPGGSQNYSVPTKSGNVWRRTVDSLSWVDISPSAQIDKRILLDISMDVKIPYDECTVVGGCDRYYAKSTTAPTIAEFYMDIVPGSITGMWQWDDLDNFDPDGDGLYAYKTYDNVWVGPDANRCPNIAGQSALTWDTDGDGLSDKFEVQTDGFNPCQSDSDLDGVKDGVELMWGTYPNNKDTDGDGLTDREEIPYDNGFSIVFPWTVQMNNAYPGLPNPAAFPNPRQANGDGDYRGDKQEKLKLSSPTSYNAIPVGEALNLYIGQAQQPGGVNSITVSAPSWQNTEAAGIDATLTVTLPVAFSNLFTQARVEPPLVWFGANTTTPINTGNPNVFSWKLPMLSLNRYPVVKITGLPATPSQPVSITAQLVYSEGAKLQIATAEAPLWYNAGGPRTEIAGVTGGVILDGGLAAADARATVYASAGGSVTVQGTAEDPERVDKVFVCLVASGACGNNDWKLANGRDIWSYTFNAPADGIYTVRAYAIDANGFAGPADEESVGVDTSAPNGLTLDQEGTVYLNTESAALAARSNGRDGAAVALEPPFVTISGQVSDQTGAAFVSGVSKVGMLINDNEDNDEYETVDVDNPGAASSTFSFKWTPPSNYGASVRNGQGQYDLTVAAQDAAGNTGAVDTLTVIIDDTPPAVEAVLPQVSTAATFAVSGLADDTALVLDRAPSTSFAASVNATSAATQFTLSGASTKAVIVRDVNGDTIDDVLLLGPTLGTLPVTLQAGLFFGKPGGFTSALALANADVKFQGETPVASSWPADGASAGDVNGDGVGDLLVGDPGHGAAYLILGRRSGWPATFNLSAADWKLTQSGASAFGGAVTSAGDVDGDGLDDLLVAASSKGAQNGPVWLYPGREQGVPAALRLFYNSRANAGIPRIAGLGDVSGDGLSDFIIAPLSVPIALLEGRPQASWPAGDINLLTFATPQFSGAASAGATVAAAGDVNGDGLRDILVGDPSAATPRVYLIHGRRNFDGSVTLSAIANASIQPGTAPSSKLGQGLATLGDVDGDGRAEFAFGQPGGGSGPNRAALVTTADRVLSTNMTVEAAAGSIFSASPASTLFGSYLTAGDISGDGIMDLLVGAPNEGKAYLFKGAFDPGGVAGIKKVEIGFFGPVTDASAPFSATLPAQWQTATLGNGAGGITPWTGQLTAPGNGDYRVYARAVDQADNQLGSTAWYMGNVWVNPATTFAGSSASMNVPSLTNKVNLSLNGAITSAQTPRALRVFDGYTWHRLVPAAGNWSLASVIPQHDRYLDVFRVVARDAAGNQIHAMRDLLVDTLVASPVLSATLPVNIWQSNSPALTISWPAVSDASGIATTLAVINTVSNTTPSTAVGGNQVAATLSNAGSYYGHVLLRDGAGNEVITRVGPFLVNRTQTPSVILADGYLDFAGNEYPTGTLLNYDPYAEIKPAALWGTWTATQLFLGFPGNPWGSENKLAFYLDTKSGGLTSSLNLAGNVHTLPFGADFAFVVGGELTGGEAQIPMTLYQVSGGNWVPVTNAKSYAILGGDTELVLDRAEIGATGAVALLAYAENSQGVWAVLPGGARQSTEPTLPGAITFADKLAWGSLAAGVQPSAGIKQIYAPVVTILPAVQKALGPAQTTTFQAVIHNPDVAPYVNVPISLTTESPMVMKTLVSGATCSSCPNGGNKWDVLVNVAAGGTQTVTVGVEMGGSNLQGVFPVGIVAGMIGSGLPVSPQIPANGYYVLDQGVAAVEVLGGGGTIYRQPGEIFLPIEIDLDLSQIARCISQVEVNTGSGWQNFCRLGDCNVFTGNVGVDKADIQIRVNGGNGRFSEMTPVTVMADSVLPVIEMTPKAVLSGTLDFIEGIVWDGFPTTKAPQRVEVSINGGNFVKASVSKQRRVMQRSGVETETAVWRLPLSFEGYEGQTLQVVARAIDEAGNVSQLSAPMTLTLDSLAPTITVTQTEKLITGTVKDGSGVASVEVSLDGGVTYQPMTRRGDNVTFDVSGWTGGPVQAMAMVRAADSYGNTAVALLPVTVALPAPIYLPLIQSSQAINAAAAPLPVQETPGEEVTGVESTAPEQTAPYAERVDSSPAAGWQIFLPSVSQGD